MAREDGPFEYFDERTGAAGVNANSIRTNLTDPDRNNNAIVAMATTLEQDGQRAASQVEGDIDTAVRNLPEGARATATNLGANGAYALGLMRSFAESVETFDNTVSDCNWQYRTQLASALRWAGRAAAETEDTKDDAKVDEAHLGPGIESHIRQNEYNPAWNKLDGEIEALVGDFNQGPSNERVRDLIRQGLLPLAAAGLYPGLTLTEADKTSYYEHVLGTMSPDEQKEWIEANLDHLDPAVANVVDPTVMEYFADEVADDIQDPENIDDRTVALMNFFKGEEKFADRLYTTVTPQQMSDAIAHLNYELFGAGDPDDATSNGYRELDGPPPLDLYNNFMNAAGVALATHSNSSSVDPTALARTWFDAITDDENRVNGAALTMLIREGGEQPDGNFNATFIDRLSSDVLDWERQQDSPVWADRNGDGGIWIRDPDSVQIDEYTDANGNMKYSVSEERLGSDGMANLLAGMGHSPEGAQRFFMTSDGEVDKDRLDYLMLHRTFADSRESDEGDGLGEALQAAVIGGREGHDGDFTQGEADKLASSVFKLISENSSIEDKGDLGNDPYGGKLDGGTGNGWHIWENMSDSLGAIGAGYADDIYAEVGPGSGSESRLQGVSDRDILRVVAEIGGTEDQTGLETVLAAVANSGVNHEVGANLNTFTQNQIDNGEPINMTEFAKSGITLDTRVIGETLGKLINASDDVYSDKALSESERAAMAAKAFEIGTSFLPGAGRIIGEGGSQILETAIDTGKGEVISTMQNAIRGDGPAAAPNHSRGLEDSIRYAISNQFLQHGMLNEQPDPNNADGGRYAGVNATHPPITTTNHSGAPVFDPDLFFDTDSAPDNHPGWDAYQNTSMENTIREQTGDMTDGMAASLSSHFNSDKPTVD